MINTKKESRLNIVIAGLVVFHGAMILLRGFVHEIIDISYHLQEHLPFLCGFIFLPIAASMLLSSRQQRLGCVLLLGIIPAEAIIMCLQSWSPLPFTPQFLTPAGWTVLFKIFSFGIIAVEILIVWLGVRLFLFIHKRSSGSQAVNESHR